MKAIDKLSFQLYSARFLQPLDRQIELLAGLGYRHVEPFGGLFSDVPKLRELLHAHGLTAPSAHVGHGTLGYRGVQLPSWDGRFLDLAKAASSKTYCDEIAGVAAANDVAITELSTHLQGQLVAVHPAYDSMFDGFAPEAVRGKPAVRQAWAVEQMKLAARASRHFGLDASVSFPGALAWPFLYPWPQRPAGLIETAFAELGKRWTPILDVYEEHGVDVCFEIHPGEDVFDGATFEMFLDATRGHRRSHHPRHGEELRRFRRRGVRRRCECAAPRDHVRRR